MPNGTYAVPSKNAVSANIKHSRTGTFITHHISGQSTTVVKGMYIVMFDMVDTAFGCGRAFEAYSGKRTQQPK